MGHNYIGRNLQPLNERVLEVEHALHELEQDDDDVLGPLLLSYILVMAYWLWHISYGPART